MWRYIVVIVICLILMNLVQVDNIEVLFIRGEVDDGCVINSIKYKAIDNDKILFDDGIREELVFFNYIPEDIYFKIMKESNYKIYYMYVVKKVLFVSLYLVVFICSLIIIYEILIKHILGGYKDGRCN